MTRSKPQIAAIRAACTRHLNGHGPKSARAWAEALAANPDLDLPLDIYSEGPAIARLEAETAALLGKPAGLFFHKGITAQLAAFLVHAEATGRTAVALHARSHLAQDESDALDRLCRLHALRTGPFETPFTAADLAYLHQPLAAVTVELPLRRAGFLATPWPELEAIAAWCRANHTPFHIDGARLWEVAPHYGKSLAEIAALADTIYVSFYKGLGGMGGCVLAGPQGFIDACRPWRNRFGGDLPTIHPYVLTALAGLRHHLPQMPAYHAKAAELAAALAAIPGVRLLPATPHGNSFTAWLQAAPAALEQAHAAHAEATGAWLFNRVLPSAFPDTAGVEIVAGEATLGWTGADLASHVRALLATV